MLYNWCSLFILFLIYSIVGYIVEVIFVSFLEKKLVFNRGFLIGPYLPIYGTGAIMMIKFLEKYQDDIIILFIMSVVLCTVLEYLTSLIMERIFKLRWWDYSKNSFNINGRVCLSNSILFGTGGLIVIKLANPFLRKMIYLLPSTATIILGIILIIIFVTDIIISTYIIFRLKINANKYTNKDATTIIKEEVNKALHKHTYLTARLIKAFPNIHTKNSNFTGFKELILKAKAEVKKIKKEYKMLKKQRKGQNAKNKK